MVVPCTAAVSTESSCYPLLAQAYRLTLNYESSSLYRIRYRIIHVNVFFLLLIMNDNLLKHVEIPVMFCSIWTNFVIFAYKNVSLL